MSKTKKPGDTLANCLVACGTAPPTRSTRLLGDFQRVCELMGSIYYYGRFRAKTANERELEALLRKLGYFFESEEQLMGKLHSPNDKLSGGGDKH